MTRDQLETTCRMQRDELLGLLNTMTPLEQQRVTAEITVPEPPPEEAEASMQATSSGFAVKFREPVVTRGRQVRLAVVFASCLATLAVGATLLVMAS